jgi:hypothetical protein
MNYRAAAENLGTLSTSASLYEAMKSAHLPGGYVVREAGKVAIAFYDLDANRVRPTAQASAFERAEIESSAGIVAENAPARLRDLAEAAQAAVRTGIARRVGRAERLSLLARRTALEAAVLAVS